MLRTFLLTLPLAATALLAQNGDRAGEVQAERVAPGQIPPAPLLSPAEQITTFRLPPGFAVELVAAEPLVQSPVAIQFDPQGRLWVVEMTGYMPNTEGTGETEPTGNIVRLDDTDGDGRMDRRTVFLDRLVMPRALMLTGDGLLFSEPPKLWFARDTDGDGRADERHLIAENYATQNDPVKGAKSNPEHASNGLLWALDNWVYSANHDVRFRWNGSPTNWLSEPTIMRGQWGIAQDDTGRLFYNSNEDSLRGDFVPAHYLTRNPNLRQAFGANAQVARDQRVWPGRVNPGVNRGYQPKTLNAEGRLANYTAACSPFIYRGDQFPEEFRGDAFVCEPSGNFIRRNRLIDDDSVLISTNAYDQAEFLTSTDERFRPVSLQGGPDGALYVVDFARGLIQHRIYLTSYLRKQIESRNLQAPTDRGRIYRVVHTRTAPARRDALPANPNTQQLIARLSHANGFWRDTAQRLLVERADTAATEPLRKATRSDTQPDWAGRLHALWTLEGLGRLDADTVRAAWDDTDVRVRRATIRLTERLLAGPDRIATLDFVFQRAGFVREPEQIQFLLTLGEFGVPHADTLMKILLMNGPASPLRFDAAISGLRGRELAFLQSMLADPLCGPGKESHAPLFAKLARCVATERDSENIAGVWKLAADRPQADWQQLAMLDGFAALLPPPAKDKPVVPPRPIPLPVEPAGLARMRALTNAEVTARLDRLDALFTWPGKPGAPVPVRPLTETELAAFTRGKEVYTTVCAACHQPHGNGQEGLAPPLVDSEWTLGSDQRLIRIVLHGLRDAITVRGVKYDLNMPALAEALCDEQIADSLTYIRRAWGHSAEPVTAAQVRDVRAREVKREDSWTEPELAKLP
jgi:mono/diheme cytochrome c family protein/glucose/arabinose dehydrogenase